MARNEREARVGTLASDRPCLRTVEQVEAGTGRVKVVVDSLSTSTSKSPDEVDEDVRPADDLGLDDPDLLRSKSRLSRATVSFAASSVVSGQ